MNQNPSLTTSIKLPPEDLAAAILHAQHKRAQYPWNDWGRRIAYENLHASGAVVLDAWADPAFMHINRAQSPDQPKGLWLRAEVWRHPDGTAYRAVLDVNDTVVIAPLECCRRPDADIEAMLQLRPSEPPHTTVNMPR